MKRFRATLAGILGLTILLLGLVLPALADTPAPSAPARATAAPAPAVVGDPSGANTGGAADVVGATAGAPTQQELDTLSKSEPLAGKLADVIGHDRIAINLVWTLFAGFLVMFMQAGFALVETGFTRAKNAAHTMAMNFMVYALGMLGFFVCGFALQMGGVRQASPPWAVAAGNNHEVVRTSSARTFGLFGTKGFFLSGEHIRCRGLRHLPVPDGLHGHDRDDPHRLRWPSAGSIKSFFIFGFFVSVFIYPALRVLGLGRRLAGRSSASTSGWATATSTSPAPPSST